MADLAAAAIKAAIERAGVKPDDGATVVMGNVVPAVSAATAAIAATARSELAGGRVRSRVQTMPIFIIGQ